MSHFTRRVTFGLWPFILEMNKGWSYETWYTLTTGHDHVKL